MRPVQVPFLNLIVGEHKELVSSRSNAAHDAGHVREWDKGIVSNTMIPSTYDRPFSSCFQVGEGNFVAGALLIRNDVVLLNGTQYCLHAGPLAYLDIRDQICRWPLCVGSLHKRDAGRCVHSLKDG